MDCADENGISEVFPEEERQENLVALSKRRFTPAEKKENLTKMSLYIKKREENGQIVLPILLRRE